MNTNFSPWPSYSEEEMEAVRQVLLSGRVNAWTGEHCRLFEEEFARINGCRYAVALANGSLALEAALRAVGVGSGDEVITTPRTFFATASSIVLVGGRPVFADIDRNSQNITADSIAKVLSSRTKAIVVVHLAGMPADMDPVMELARQHGLKVIEDCAQAHGARYKGRAVGTIGDVGAWSFCQDKIITTGGEGGMVTTNDEQLWSFLWSYKDHGKSYDAVYNRPHPRGFRWLHESFGSNWRMTEMQAAIGRIQLRRLADWRDKRHKNSVAIDKAVAGAGAVRTVVVPADVIHAHYKHYLFVKPENLANGWSRDRIVQEIINRDVPCFHTGCPEVYLEKAFEQDYRHQDRLPVAKELGETSLMLLVHPTLRKSEIEKTCTVVREVAFLAGAEGCNSANEDTFTNI